MCASSNHIFGSASRDSIPGNAAKMQIFPHPAMLPFLPPGCSKKLHIRDAQFVVRHKPVKPFFNFYISLVKLGLIVLHGSCMRETS